MIHPAPTVELVDALGHPLRDAPLHTFSNAPATPAPTLEDIVKVAHEIQCRSFRWRSFEWFATRFLRRFTTMKPLSASAQGEKP